MKSLYNLTFLTETCKSKNIKITRGNEGLYGHHIDEYKAIKLSKPEFAIKNLLAYQKADGPVYCDILEHFILHIKIIEEPKGKNGWNWRRRSYLQSNK